MVIAVLAYLGGVLTIFSPCILPVLPFVFARADQPFVKTGLPLLAGMALTFAAVATLAAVGGGWAVRANEFGRIAALVLLALFGLTLLIPAIADRLTRPIVALGNRLSQSAASEARDGESVPRVLCAWHCDRAALGPLRRADPRPGSDRRRAARRQCKDLTIAARLRGRRRDFARLRSADRRPASLPQRNAHLAPASGSVADWALPCSPASPRSRWGWIRDS